MALPAVSCPCCNVQLPLEAWLAHAATREAFLALAGLHPSMRLPMTCLRYVGLFAPRRQTMRWDRIADLLAEVRALIAAGTVEWKHQTLPAPLDYWLAGMENMLARPDLKTPLGNHNYLKAVVAGMSEGSEARAESRALAQARGETPVGHSAAQASSPPKTQAERPAPRGMPAHIRDQLAVFTRGDKAS